MCSSAAKLAPKRCEASADWRVPRQASAGGPQVLRFQRLGFRITSRAQRGAACVRRRVQARMRASVNPDHRSGHRSACSTARIRRWPTGARFQRLGFRITSRAQRGAACVRRRVQARMRASVNREVHAVAVPRPAAHGGCPRLGVIRAGDLHRPMCGAAGFSSWGQESEIECEISGAARPLADEDAAAVGLQAPYRAQVQGRAAARALEDHLQGQPDLRPAQHSASRLC